LSVLSTIFNHNSFRGKQEEVIDAILQGRNCLIVLPTGAGKTICYSVQAIVSGGVTIVISPLLSLVLEQVDYLRSKGLNVCYSLMCAIFKSTVSQIDREVIIHHMLSDVPPYNFLFVTPESATSSELMDVFKKMKSKGTIKYITIDECHCIDLWGFDFRPAYANLGILSELNCQIVALTATCTSRTEAVIISSLKLTDAIVIREKCNRPNISFFVKLKKGNEQVADKIITQQENQCGVVYCLQRGVTTDMAYILQSKGVTATYYHGALDAYKKKDNAQAWQKWKSTCNVRLSGIWNGHQQTKC
jgi:RecQ family ATP-dependent DNA helicase